MARLHGSPQSYYAGSAMLLAMLIGGGTGQELWSDHFIMLALAPSWYFALADTRPLRLTAPAIALLVAIGALLAGQFLPVWRSGPSGLDDEFAGLAFRSIAPAQSWFSSLYVASLAGYFLMLGRMREREQQRLLRFLIVGLCANLAVAILQLSFDGSASITGILPYEIRMGMFANENHFSTLAFIAIPLLAWHWLVRGSGTLQYGIFCVALLVVQFAAGSRAGVLLALALIAICTAAASGGLAQAGRWRIVIVCAALVGCAVFAARTAPSIDSDLRLTIAANTFSALADPVARHWLAGSGLGSFAHLYPAYEPLEQISRFFANHAHNDWLEIWLETGIPGLLLAIGVAVLIGVHARRNAFAGAAGLAIAAIGLHSLVDYPLRTMAIAVPFTYLCAVVLSSLPELQRDRVAAVNEPLGYEAPVRVRSPG